MKYSLYFILLLTLSGCRVFECESVAHRHLTLLVDVSDAKLFDNITTDLDANFPRFMTTTGLGAVAECQSFTLSLAHLGGHQTLSIASETIALREKGLSYQQIKEQTSPDPVMNLLRQKMNDFSILTEDPVITASTNIGNVLLKSILNGSGPHKSYYVLMTDGVENTPYLNFYQRMPGQTEVSDLIPDMVEESVLERYLLMQASGAHAKIFLVLKPEPNNRLAYRSVKSFWIGFFESLELEYEIIDDLSNQVTF